MRLFLVALLFSLVAFTTGASAHGGGTDYAGCHLNHSTGIYHCH
jgi:hypothetical protein